MYLSSASSILPGDKENAARELADAESRRYDAAVQSVMGRIGLWETIMSPAELASIFGAQTGANALAMQNETADARQDAILGSGTGTTASTTTSATTTQAGSGSTATQAGSSTSATSQQAAIPTVKQIIASAPHSYSLNGQPSQVDGCVWAPAPPISLSPSPSPTMPLLAPVVVQTTIGSASLAPGRQPKYSNLCWALRNGLVSQDQFTFADYMKLSQRCGEQGYAGACPPPTDVTTWFIRQRAAGTLPQIAISDAELAAIPHAPDLQGLSCDQAMIAGGLTGYAPSWSDALVTDSQAQMDNPDAGVGAWIADHPWLSLAIAVGGAVMLSRRDK